MSLAKDTGLYSFEGWHTPVPAHRHLNPDGSIGGWVANTAVVLKDAYVAENALVFGRARILAPARIRRSARVFGHCRILAPVDVGERAEITDSGVVRSQRDIRWGPNWSAFSLETNGVSLRFWHDPNYTGSVESPTWLESWSDLPEALYRRGLVSALEYLAAVAEMRFSKESP